MRPTAGAIQRYTPDVAPQDPAALRAYLERELNKIAASMSAISDGQLDKTTVAPDKPRAGMIRFADGTSWNPGGTGVGFYGYTGAAWVKF